MKALLTLVLLTAGAQAQLTEAAPAVQSACSAAVAAAPLPGDMAGLAVPASYPQCDSYSLYEKQDYKAARACAITERSALLARLPDSPAKLTPAGEPHDEANDGGDPAGGPVVLAELYANGEGIARDPALAARFLCEGIDTNEVEHDPDPDSAKKILDTLGRARAMAEGSARFDLCETAGTDFPDHSTSQPPEDTPQTRYCIRRGEAEWESQYPAIHAGGIQEADDDAQKGADDAAAALKPLLGRLTAGQKVVYRRLIAAFDGFLNKQVTGGSLFCAPYSGCDVPGQDSLSRNYERGDLDTQVAAMLKAKPKAESVAALSKADGELNRVYGELIAAARLAATVPHETVTPAMLHDEERAWLAYRDAFVPFGRAIYPDLPATTWLLPLTVGRASDLQQVYELNGKKWVEEAKEYQARVAESIASTAAQAELARAKVGQYFDHQTPAQAAAWQQVQAALADFTAAHKAAVPNVSPTYGQRQLDGLYGELYGFWYNEQHGFFDTMDRQKVEEGFAASEQRLSEAYEADLNSACLFLPVRDDPPSVHRTAEGLRAEQAAWVKLRDAWMDFLALLFPQIPRDGLGNAFTGGRTFELKMLDNSCQRYGQAPKEQ